MVSIRGEIYKRALRPAAAASEATSASPAPPSGLALLVVGLGGLLSGRLVDIYRVLDGAEAGGVVTAEAIGANEGLPRDCGAIKGDIDERTEAVKPLVEDVGRRGEGFHEHMEESNLGLATSLEDGLGDGVD